MSRYSDFRQANIREQRNGQRKRIFLNRNMSLLLLFVSCTLLLQVQSTTVSTRYGKIEGLTPASYPNAPGPFKSVSKFLGVPFASPPIGDLRFEAPQPPKEWKPKVRQAKRHGNICWQPKTYEFRIRPFAKNFSYSEDCLYLDVYTPNVSLSLPVMVYIHGGGYEIGTAIRFPSDILALQGVVVVVIQYRLGPFGFLTTGDSAAPGNFGMLDQVEALKWVKENIENFGGNPGKVTIFGASAGGSSVSLHLLSPLSKGLFHQAIAESGVDLSIWATQPVSFGLQKAKELAKELDCATSNSKDMMDCIRSKEDTDIEEASESVIANFRYVDYLLWAPVVDKNFLHDTPQNLRKKNEFHKVPLMISFNSHEGANLVSATVNASFVTPGLFKSLLTKFAHALNSG